MMAHIPEAVIHDHAARRPDLAGHLRTGTAPGREWGPQRHSARLIPSFSIHTLVAKKSRIIAAWS
jgi:hypothetical protein